FQYLQRHSSSTETIHYSLAPARERVVLSGPTRRVSFERVLGLETLTVPPDGCHSERFTAAQKIHSAVESLETPGEPRPLPVRGVTNVRDGYVVVCAPEEGHRVESLPQTQDIPSRRLPLPLGNHPVFDSNPFATVRVGPTRNIPSGEN